MRFFLKFHLSSGICIASMHQPAPWFIPYRVALRFRKMLRCDKRLRWAIGTWIALMLRNGEHAIRASLPGSKMPGTLFLLRRRLHRGSKSDFKKKDGGQWPPFWCRSTRDAIGCIAMAGQGPHYVTSTIVATGRYRPARACALPAGCWRRRRGRLRCSRSSARRRSSLPSSPSSCARGPGGRGRRGWRW